MESSSSNEILPEQAQKQQEEEVQPQEQDSEEDKAEEKKDPNVGCIPIRVRMANCWQSFIVQVPLTDLKQNSKFWDHVVHTLKEQAPDFVKTFVSDSQTLYYNRKLQALKSSFETQEINSLASDEALFYIIPATYTLHPVKKLPYAIQLQIEGEYPSEWFLHKTDVKASDNYFEQLKIDLEKAKALHLPGYHSPESVPELKPQVHYRFFTQASDSPSARSLTQEIPKGLLDDYLIHADRPKWVIRSNGSVESECALYRHTFSLWTHHRNSERKILVPTAVAEEKELAKDKKVKGLKFSFLTPEEQDKEHEQQDSTQEGVFQVQQPSTQPSLLSSSFPLKTDSVVQKGGLFFGSMHTKLRTFGGYLRRQMPFKWVADRQRDETSATDAALYFALAIIAAVIIAVIIIVGVVIAQKNKSNQMRKREEQWQRYNAAQAPPQTSLPSMPPPSGISFTSVREGERPTTSQQTTVERDTFYVPEEDYANEAAEYSDDDTQTSAFPPASSSTNTHRKQIDQIIASQNPHFHEAQRAEYTKQDLQEDLTAGKKSNKYFFRKDLGFPPTPRPKSSSCSGDNVCSLPNKRTVTIPF